MARLIGPDAGQRGTLRPGGHDAARGASVVVYAADTGDTLADILTEDGDAVPGSTLTTDLDYGLIPAFQFPDGVDTVYVEVAGGPRTEVNARYEARVDDLSTRVADLEANPGGSVVTLDADGTLTVDGTTVEVATDQYVVDAAAAAVNLSKGLPLGLTGAAQPTRFVGKWTQTGAPTAGTFAVGDFGFDATGDIYVCTTAGTPGAWRMHGAGTSLPVPDDPADDGKVVTAEGGEYVLAAPSGGGGVVGYAALSLNQVLAAGAALDFTGTSVDETFGSPGYTIDGDGNLVLDGGVYSLTFNSADSSFGIAGGDALTPSWGVNAGPIVDGFCTSSIYSFPADDTLYLNATSSTSSGSHQLKVFIVRLAGVPA